ncbi:hypothetical protein ACHAXT_001194 [Thalassiosira profunda]
MPSLAASPTHAHAPLGAGGSAAAAEGPRLWSGRKRRPVDPEETSSLMSPAAPYDSELAGPSSKRPRTTLDDVMSSMSLRPPDPPGNFGGKRKSEDRMEDDRSKLPRTAGVLSSTGDESADAFANGSSTAVQRSQDPVGRKGGSPTNVASLHPPSAQQSTSYARQDTFRGNSTSDSNNHGNHNSNEMSIDDSDHESDSSVSEGSIKNAMYQLVFGRRNPVGPKPTVNGNVAGGRYDAVDSKIEDLIRRSRLQAAVNNQKQERGHSNSSMDIDDVDEGGTDELGGDEEWNPGHG